MGKPTLGNAKKIVKVLDKKGSGRNVKLELLWDNGYRGWASLKDAEADAKQIVRKYLKLTKTQTQ